MLAGATDAGSCSLCQPGTYSTGSGVKRFGARPAEAAEAGSWLGPGPADIQSIDISKHIARRSQIMTSVGFVCFGRAKGSAKFALCCALVSFVPAI